MYLIEFQTATVEKYFYKTEKWKKKRNCWLHLPYFQYWCLHFCLPLIQSEVNLYTIIYFFSIYCKINEVYFLCITYCRWLCYFYLSSIDQLSMSSSNRFLRSICFKHLYKYWQIYLTIAIQEQYTKKSNNFQILKNIR